MFKRWRTLTAPGQSGPLLAATIGVSLLAIWVIFTGIAYETYRNEWSTASVYSENVATLLERDIARTFELYDLSLKALSQDGEDAAVMSLPEPMRRKALFDHSAEASDFGSLLLLDRNGKVTTDSKAAAKPGLDFSDREYFTRQREGTALHQPFVSHLFQSRLTGQNMVGFSRPMVTADGQFDGVAVGTISSGLFEKLFRSVKLPPDSSIMLVHEDGSPLMRVPMVADAVATAFNTDKTAAARAAGGGTYVDRSIFDGEERLYALKQVGKLPLYLIVGFSTYQILADWLWRAQLIGVGFIILSALVLLLAVLLTRELQRRAEAERTLSVLAATDSLTLIANRRRFDETLALEWRRAVREGTRLSLLMIDGDFFKAFNDTYGHLEGDQALRIIAETLQTCVERPGDLVARFGGEEFVVLLPRTEGEGAYKVAVAIRQAVAVAGLTHVASPFGRLTVSIGVATRHPKQDEVPSSLIEDADAALYQAKADGRDRIIVADEPASSMAARSISAA